MFSDIATLASTQHGVFSAAQAIERGASRRQLQHWVVTSRCHRLAEGVFQIIGAPGTWHGTLLAACLTTPGALASHRSAARLWNLDGFERIDFLEVTVPFASWGRGMPEVVRHASRASHQFERRCVDSIPVTSPELTLLQLGAVASPHKVEDALDSAIRLGLTTLPRLRWQFQLFGRQGRNGTAVMRQLLDMRDGMPVPESVLEGKFVRLVRDHEVEPPQLQWKVIAGSRVVARVDAAWPDSNVIVELDGDRYHSSKRQRQADRRRDQELRALGFEVIHFDWDDVVSTPERTIGILRAVLLSHSDKNRIADSTKRRGLQTTRVTVEVPKRAAASFLTPLGNCTLDA